MAAILDELRKTSKSSLLDLVKMHLSFSIDVSTEEWDKIVEYIEGDDCDAADNDETNASCQPDGKKKDSASCKKKKKSNNKEDTTNIFGKPLTDASLKQAMSLVDYINKNDNYKIEGIFRKSGPMSRQQELRKMLDCGVKVDLEANRFTPLDCSCVLKEFIQKLPEPLLTNNHFELYYQLALTIKRNVPLEELEAKNAKRLKIIQLLLHMIPDLNRRFFISLMALLNRVANARDITFMDEHSIATIFGSNVLCPRSWQPKQVQDEIVIITDAMEFMLLNYDRLFNGPLELVMDAQRKLKKFADKNLNKQHSASSSTTKIADFATPKHLNNRDSKNCVKYTVNRKSTTAHKRHAAADNNDHEGDDDDDVDELGGDENNTVVTFCQQSSEIVTDKAVAELYAHVHAMEDTKHKKKLIKRFNKQNGSGTPMHVTGQKPPSSSSSSSSSATKWRSVLPWLSK